MCSRGHRPFETTVQAKAISGTSHRMDHAAGLPVPIRRIADVGREHFWTSRPSGMDLVKGALLYEKALARPNILLPLIFLSLLIWFASGQARRTRIKGLLESRFLPVAGLVAAFFGVELALFIRSRAGGASTFSDRYLLPLAIALIMLIAAALTPLAHSVRSRPTARRLVMLYVLVLIAVAAQRAYIYRPNEGIYPPVNFPKTFISKLPPGIPVVSTVLPYFMFLQVYNPNGKVIFLQDTSNKPEDSSVQVLISNWERSGYGNVANCQSLLHEVTDFALITSSGRDEWPIGRLQAVPTLEVKKIGETPDWFPVTIWSVHPTRPSSVSCALRGTGFNGGAVLCNEKGLPVALLQVPP